MLLSNFKKLITRINVWTDSDWFISQAEKKVWKKWKVIYILDGLT